jgi:hypothetical protein
MRLVGVLSIILTMSGPAYAEADAEGLGIHSCAKFAKDFQEDPQYIELAYFHWATGFLTAANVSAQVANQPRRDLSAMSGGEQRQFLRRYCNEHPLGNYIDGVVELWASLPLFHEKPQK